MRQKLDLKKWQKIALVAAVVGLLAITGGIMIATRPAEVREQFELSEVVYQEEGLKEITATEYEEMLAEGESFLVLVHAMACPAGMPLTDLSKELAHEMGMTVYSLIQEEFKKSSLAEKFKYIPSMAIIHDGQVVAWLDAESDEDLPAYKTLNGLQDWLKQYIKL